jgi:pilus assembly protein CpaF
VHANSPRDGLSRLETMVLMAGTELPSRAIREQIVSAIHVLVHVRRFEDGVRRVEHVAEITGIEGTTPLIQPIFEFKRRGRQDRRVMGDFIATGIVPRAVEELRDQGVAVPLEIFDRRRS